MIECNRKFNLHNFLRYLRPFNPIFLSRYLQDVYRELSTEHINKVIFLEYIDAPLFIAEKLFSLFDEDRDGVLSSSEFEEGFLKLCSGSSLDMLNLIFNFCDINKDGKIIQSDIRIILTYLSVNLINKGIDTGFNESKIESLLELYFNSEQQVLKFKEFYNVTVYFAPDLFLILAFLIIKSLPFSKNTINLYQQDKRINKMENEKNSTEFLEEVLKYSSYPVKIRNLFNAEICEIMDVFCERKCLGQCLSGCLEEKMGENTETENFQKEERESCIIDSGFTDVTQNSSSYKSSMKSLVYENNQENDKILIINFSDLVIKDRSSFQTTKTEIEMPPITYESYIYKFDKIKNRLTKVFICLIGRELYYFKNSSKSKLRGMHFLRIFHTLTQDFDDVDKNLVTFDNQNYYFFSLFVNNKKREFYTRIAKDFVNWTTILRKTLYVKELSDSYELQSTIYLGNYVCVKKGRDVKTDKIITMKIYSKEEIMKESKKMEMLIKERDILFDCNHKNIVKLNDFFEDLTYIYFVFDYLENEDLFSFLNKNRELSVHENLKILWQICEGISYLHSKGIVHRDIKPQNIGLTSNLTVKIFDFQFSHVMGEYETASDSYGTLLFAPPEILLKLSYDKKIDIWSLGVTMYFLFTRKLLFEDDKSLLTAILEENKSINLDICKELNNGINQVYIPSIIDLISKCLQRDPHRRCDIKEVINHEIFKNLNLEINPKNLYLYHKNVKM